MAVITDRDQWYLMLTTGGTRNVPSRCCGRITFYERCGDEWCTEHRCAKVTKYGRQCTRKVAYGDECAQHFGISLRAILSACV